jgi:hypothetical protein
MWETWDVECVLSTNWTPAKDTRAMEASTSMRAHDGSDEDENGDITDDNSDFEQEEGLVQVASDPGVPMLGCRIEVVSHGGQM